MFAIRRIPTLVTKRNFSMSAAPAADRFIEFVNKAPTQFHAVAELSALYEKAGFKKISEKDFWEVEPNGKYYFTRNQSCLLAFAVGGGWQPGNGFVIQGAHTDSPVLKLKPVSKITHNEMLQVGVQCYGGGLWHTWFDRDLSLAGRVLVRESAHVVRSRLVNIRDPIVRIPNLAIHLNRAVSEGFKFNTETELVPILASQLKVDLHYIDENLSEEEKEAKKAEAAKKARLGNTFSTNHHSVLIDRVAKELNVPAEAIVDFELCLYDTQPAQRTGLYKEFVSARALDNLLMSFVCSEAIIKASDPTALKSAKQVFMTVLFDNEEVGSGSMMGAGSNLLNRVLTRINGEKSLDVAVARSILVSADMAHAIHPNYASKHEDNHRVAMQRGLVIKENANLRYATNPITMFHVQDLAEKLEIPIQQFCVRNDSPCGSTIGPILAASCGMRTIDVGVPQWAMHSIRETCGVDDIESALRLLSYYFPAFYEADSKLKVDEQ